MKKSLKIFIAGILLALMGFAVKSYAGRCQDLCIPKTNATCPLLYGDDGDLTVCGGYEPWVMIS
jgi:hypothetical protein